MSGPPAAVAAVRVAVRRALTGPEAPASGDLVLVAASGGADSLALLSAATFVGPRLGLRVGAVTVDHAWEPGSAERAVGVRDLARAFGAEPAEVLLAPSTRSEDAARRARYDALDEAATCMGATRVLLAHSLDDQAETVLLGLARGSGARSLAGMAVRRGVYLRPLLDIRRATLREAVAAAGLQAWDDPANVDPQFTRSRVRHQLLPVLEESLGAGAVEALARTARLLRADADALDGWAAAADPGTTDFDVPELLALPEAVRSRVVRATAVRAGVPAGSLTARHVAGVEALLTDWHGQGPVMLPGGVRAVRACGRLTIEPAEST